MKKELILIILNICLSFSANAQADNFAVCDTITDIWGKQIVGKTIFKATANEINREKTYLYFMKGYNEDSLIIVSDLSANDFSLGGPYEQTRDSVLLHKFSKYKDVANITQDRMDLDLPEAEYGPPYLFSVVIGNDTIEYQSDLKKQNYYGFAEAFINDSRFCFAGCQVGKHIKETSFGTHITDKTLKKIKNIEVWPSHYVHLQNTEYDINKDCFLSIDIDEGYIKRLFVYSNGYY